MSVLIILCLLTTTFVTSEIKVHRVFVSRKTGSDSVPIETGYMYNQLNDKPGTLSVFGNDRTTSEPVLENYSNLKKLLPIQQYHPIDFSKQIFRPSESSLSKRDTLDHAIAKAESKYNANFLLPSKKKNNGKYERLKSATHQPANNEMISRYDINDYHTDDNDIRTSARGVYDNWPSYAYTYHHNPYEYEHMKINSDIEKAKDKRYAVDVAKVIPIHEELYDDIPNSYEPVFTTDHYRVMTTDNPMTGHDPFFAFVLNDYFDKQSDDDRLSFKGLDWGSEFDFARPVMDIDDFKRSRRLEGRYHLPDHGNTNLNIRKGDNEIKAVHGDSITEKGFTNKHDFEKHEKGDKGKLKDKTKFEQNEQKQTEFKDFVESFANKFGGEDHKKDATFALKSNQDNSEKRKGFHRVYHKDEYQEDKEFYNNNDNSAKSEIKGSSNAHIGGSEGLLSSHALAGLGSQSNSFNKAGDTEKNTFENNHTGHDNSKGFDEHFNRYRDVAKQTAQSNIADYSDHYRL